METIKAFKCSDGTIKDNKADALIHERLIEIRGVIQRNSNPSNGFNTTAVAQVIILCKTELLGVIRKYDRQLCQLLPKE